MGKIYIPKREEDNGRLKKIIKRVAWKELEIQIKKVK